MYKPSSFPIFFPAKIKKEHTPELSYLFCVLLMRLVCARAAHNCLIVFWTRSEASPRLKLYNLWPRQASRPLYCRPIIMYVLRGLSLDDMQYLLNHNSSSFLSGSGQSHSVSKKGTGYCFRFAICRTSIDQYVVWHLFTCWWRLSIQRQICYELESGFECI